MHNQRDKAEYGEKSMLAPREISFPIFSANTVPASRRNTPIQARQTARIDCARPAVRLVCTFRGFSSTK